MDRALARSERDSTRKRSHFRGFPLDGPPMNDLGAATSQAARCPVQGGSLSRFALLIGVQIETQTGMVGAERRFGVFARALVGFAGRLVGRVRCGAQGGVRACPATSERMVRVRSESRGGGAAGPRRGRALADPAQGVRVDPGQRAQLGAGSGGGAAVTVGPGWGGQFVGSSQLLSRGLLRCRISHQDVCSAEAGGVGLRAHPSIRAPWSGTCPHISARVWPPQGANCGLAALEGPA